jgi:uncharacterized membrane protein
MFVLAAVSWPAAPDRIPVHWDITGQPTRYGGKFEGLLLVPLITAGVYLLFLLAPVIDPRGRNYEAFARTYSLIRTSVVATMCALYLLLTHTWIRGLQLDVVLAVNVSVGMLLIVLGNYMPKVRSNWFVGVRTPWTLESEYAWRKTHRMAGPLFVAEGIVLIVLSITRPAWALPALIAVVTLGAVIPTVYSYFAWRDDPNRRRPAGSFERDPAGGSK